MGYGLRFVCPLLTGPTLHLLHSDAVLSSTMMGGRLLGAASEEVHAWAVGMSWTDLMMVECIMPAPKWDDENDHGVCQRGHETGALVGSTVAEGRSQNAQGDQSTAICRRQKGNS